MGRNVLKLVSLWEEKFDWGFRLPTLFGVLYL